MPGAGGWGGQMGNQCLMGAGFQSRKVKNLEDEWSWALSNDVNVVSANELYSSILLKQYALYFDFYHKIFFLIILSLLKNQQQLRETDSFDSLLTTIFTNPELIPHFSPSPLLTLGSGWQEAWVTTVTMRYLFLSRIWLVCDRALRSS